MLQASFLLHIAAGHGCSLHVVMLNAAAASPVKVCRNEMLLLADSDSLSVDRDGACDHTV
jgi:hypothetical protein